LIFGYLVICIIKLGPATFYSSLWAYSDISLLGFVKQMGIISFSGVFYNLAWWSLQMEVVFYFFTPLYVVFFLYFVKELKYIQIFRNLLVVLVGFYLLQLYLTSNYPAIYSNEYPVVNVYRFIDFPISFLLGAYLARFDFQPFVGAIFMIFGGILILFTNQYIPLINAGYSFLYAGIVVFAFRKKWIQRFLSQPILIWIGERTYSLFLMHFSVFYLVDYLFSLVLSGRNIYYGIFTRSLGITLAVFFAMLLFHFVEKRQAKGLVTGDIFWPWHLKKLKTDIQKKE
jgi:peptidoglycan/LPS O-acetylase OafA/YrhL